MLQQRQDLEEGRERAESVPPEEWSPLVREMLAALPYQLTGSQQRACAEIVGDLRRKVPMSRLLQVTLETGAIFFGRLLVPDGQTRALVPDYMI